ncbi:ALG9-like protein [Mya arenaria]|uniref:Mannosyltransferase n=1 Tax=Mya arenaria TaxID=6604 RepID=A0ABY7G0M7_MYAAR|nr:ALG9-like protein [Mya arenaria]
MAASTKRRLQGKSIKELAALSNPIEREKPVEPHPIIEHDDPVWAPAPYTVFKVFMSARLCAAAWNIVGDCDETFNYWEPTHYLMFGKGFQTWEYSPEYAIRSYAYLMLHTLPMRLYGLIFTPNPVMMGVCRQFGNNVGRIIVCFQLIGAGFFISSTAYLPSRVEPFSYYIINGLLNFNIVFPLALVSAPFVILSNYILKVKTQGIPIWLSLAGMYIWAAIFFTRPHKEERFLFPIYPLIAVAGAVSVDYIQLWWRCVFVRSKGGHYVDHTSWISVFVGIFFTLMSVSRIVAVYQDRPVTLCVGKEWYRYPSSFFLPGQNWNLHYLKSEFEGQLPKPYDSGPDATRIIPSNMNDMNKEEPSRYVNVSKCHYLVDLDLPRETTHEPRYSQKTEEWTTLVSIPFLDASRSHRVFRAFYIPFVSSRYCVYENYNLLKTTRTKKTNRSQKHTR